MIAWWFVVEICMCGRRMVVRSVGYGKAVDGGSKVEEDLTVASSGGA